MCYKCNDCGAIFEHTKEYVYDDSNGNDVVDHEGCPECGSDDYSVYDEGQEAYDSTQR